METRVLNFFGFFIMASIALGVLFPYTAVSMMPLGFVFLFILMVLAGLTIEWGDLPRMLEKPLDVLVGNILVFVFFPIMTLFLANQLLGDAQLLYGVVFSSMMPVAMVAPFFTGIVGGDKELSFMLMVTSMLASPFVTPFLVEFYLGPVIPISTWFMFKTMIVFIPAPLAISVLVKKFLPYVDRTARNNMTALNIICLSVIIFILFGVSFNRMSLNYVTYGELGALGFLALFQDFGTLLIAGFICSMIYTKKETSSLKVSLSMRNIAIAAGILLFYDPKAALAPAVGFIAHALLFSFIPVFRKHLSN